MDLVLDKLHEEPCLFQFFQAVRLLERIGVGREPVGQFVNPASEAVRFGMHNALVFPASQIQEIDWPEYGPPRMALNFMGLTGMMGALPYAYTELILERIRAIGKLAAFQSVQRGDTVISAADVQTAAATVQLTSDTEFCPPRP